MVDLEIVEKHKSVVYHILEEKMKSMHFNNSVFCESSILLG
jgi:hypothetical protein